MKKDTHIIIGICIIFLLAAGVLFWWQQNTTSNISQEQILSLEQYSSKSEDTLEGNVKSERNIVESKAQCAVYVSGAVKKPGLFHYSGTARVSDAIESAGGFTKKADKNAVNLARILTDGEQILVPSKQKTSSRNTSNMAEKGQENHFININRASLDELMTLPGIGEAKAGAIIEYRNQNGAFSKKEELMNISGIKEGVYNKIKSFIVIA